MMPHSNDSPSGQDRYRIWQTDLFAKHWFSPLFVSVMGSLAKPIYEWAGNLMLSDVDDSVNCLCDIGAGNGLMSASLGRKISRRRFTLVEPSAAQIRAGKKVHEQLRQQHQVDIVQAAAESLPLEDNSQDFVFSTGSINLWTDPSKGLAECWRVLRPAGVLWVFDQAPCNTLPLVYDALVRKRMFGLGIPGYSVPQVRQMLRESTGIDPGSTLISGSLYGMSVQKKE